MENPPLGAVLIHAGRRTEVTKLVVAFRKFANGPKTDCRRSAPQTSLLFAYILDTHTLGYESDLVRSQRAERYYYIGVALSVKLWERIEIHLHSFVTSESDGSEWSASRPGLFTLEEELRYPLNKRLCGPRCGRFLRREKSLIIR